MGRLKDWKIEILKDGKIERLNDRKIERLKDWKIERLKDGKIERLKDWKIERWKDWNSMKSSLPSFVSPSFTSPGIQTCWQTITGIICNYVQYRQGRYCVYYELGW